MVSKEYQRELYESPELVTHGTLRQLTAGLGNNSQGDPVGDPRSHNPSAKPAPFPDAIYDTGSSS